MKGVYMKEPWQVEVVDLPSPQPGPGQALIRVRTVGICGSDIGAYRGANPLVSYPRVLGHEIAGEVLSIPENSKGIRPGSSWTPTSTAAAAILAPSAGPTAAPT